MKIRFLAPFSAALLIALAVAGCGLKNADTGPEPTRFLKSTGVDHSGRIERLPFKQSWRDPKLVISKYKYIVVRPVTTAFLQTVQWEESKSPFVPDKRTYQRRCSALASYWSKSLNKAFSSPICVFYKTTDTSRPGTLILEVALTEVRFDPTAPQTLGGASPTGTVTSMLTGMPFCAFEARVTDAATGNVVSTAADRRGPDMKVIDSERKTSAAANEEICDVWSRQLMETSNIEIFPKVKRNWFSIF